MFVFSKECSDHQRKQNDIEPASSMEAERITDLAEEHNPMRRTLKQCRSYKSTQCKLLLVMAHPPPVCAESTAAFCGLYALSLCVKNMETQSPFWRGPSSESAHWMRVSAHDFFCGHL